MGAPTNGLSICCCVSKSKLSDSPPSKDCCNIIQGSEVYSAALAMCAFINLMVALCPVITSRVYISYSNERNRLMSTLM